MTNSSALAAVALLTTLVAGAPAAAHPHELPASSATHLYLDVQQQGLGSASCGPDVRPEYQLRPRLAEWKVTFSLN